MGCTFIESILLSAGGNTWIYILQALLLVAIFWVLLHKAYQHERNEVTDEDINSRLQESLAQWNPEDLVVPEVLKDRILNPKILHGKAKKYITVDGQRCLNLSTMNFLDLIGDKKIEEQAIEAIRKYGVGSCGPRGFYGTVEVHLDLEERLAKFMGTEDAIVYSYGFSCIASAIPAYAKRHDIIFADERVNFAIQKGLYASRSTVKYFRHNDHDHLEVLLLTQAFEDQKNPEKAAKTRKFVIIEGIYMNTGELVNLPHYMELKEHFKFRLFIDESISFGTIGHGRGVTSHYNIPIKDVDMVMGSLEYSVGSIGGFCCGSKFIIEHQRLSGLGYCFSASQPPLHAVAALTAIDIMEAKPQIFTELTAACKSLHNSLRNLVGMEVRGWEESPVKHMCLHSSFIGDASQNETLLKISDSCLRRGLAVTCPSYIEKEETYDPVPSLRICVNRTLQEYDIDEAAYILQLALKEVELGHQTNYDYHEGHQQPEETNRPDHCGQGEAPQQDEDEDEEEEDEEEEEEDEEKEEDENDEEEDEEKEEDEDDEEEDEDNEEEDEDEEKEDEDEEDNEEDNEEEVIQHIECDYQEYQTSLTPEEIQIIQACQDRAIEEEGHRFQMVYQQQIRRTHHSQSGSAQAQIEDDYNQQRIQLSEIADVELDSREGEAQEEYILEALQLLEACQVICSTPPRAQESELESSQGEQESTEQLDEEDNSSHQIRRRAHPH